MPQTVKDLTVDELREVVRSTVRHAVEGYLEDLLALESPELVHSIAEAREDYRAGRVTPLEDLIDG